jgi:spermidine synthase
LRAPHTNFERPKSSGVLPDALTVGTKPYVLDSGKVRSLHFNHEEIQSAMWVAKPDALYLEYTRLMMGFLMFMPQPRSIAMIGLGGGSLAKFCYRYLPSARIVAVENSADVLALRASFCVPDDDDRFRVIEGDGAAYLGQAADGAFDAILLDGYGAAGVPTSLSSPAFYEDCSRTLSEPGVLVTNLHEAHADFALLAARIRRTFGATYEVREGTRGNCIMFAGGLEFARATRHMAVRRPLDLDREAWAQLKPTFGRILAAATTV